MKKLLKVVVLGLGVGLMFSGCAKQGYTQSNYNSVQSVQYGTIVSANTVDITDDGKGMGLGALIGGLAGSALGKGNGNTAAIVGGALIGGYAGKEYNKDIGQELFIRLKNGSEIITVIKGNMAAVGLQVKMVSANGKIRSIVPYSYRNEVLTKKKAVVTQPSGRKVVETAYLASSGQSFPARFEILN